MKNLAIIGKGSTSVIDAAKSNPELQARLEKAHIDSLHDVQIGLPQIEILHAQAKFIDPRTDQCMEGFTGIIVDTHLTNAWWHDPNGDNAYPDCVSYDGITAHESSKQIQAEACALCRLNVFGSGADGSGKACKNTRRLAVLIGDGTNALLVRLTLTPSMLKSYKDYTSKMYARNLSVYHGLTEFTLEKQTRGDRVWSIVKMKLERILTDQEFEASDELRQQAQEARNNQFNHNEINNDSSLVSLNEENKSGESNE